MPRSNRPRRSKRAPESTELDVNASRRGFKRTEIKGGIEYTVQSVSGSNGEPGKSWICPFCNATISFGTPHIVAWEESRDVESRRHFHSGCWTKFHGRLL